MVIRIRSEFAGILHENLKRLLVPPTSLPLHEIFTFSATAAVRRHLVGTYRYRVLDTWIRIAVLRIRNPVPF
jgi:hypothetical protein